MISSKRLSLPLLLSLALLPAASSHAQSRDGLLGRHDFTAEVSRQWKLPDKLNEISGLALTADARLLAVTDESAIVYELDYAEGELVKAFALGDPTVRGDFEGIAWDDGTTWLVTSKGDIFEAREGADGERVAYEQYATGLGKFCEIEGLAWRSVDSMLLILCKQLKKKGGLEGLAVFAWSTVERRTVEERVIRLPDREIASSLRMPRLNPSGIAIDAATGNLLIVAARQRALVELDATGRFVAARVLPLAVRHRQAEGIEILSGGRLLIADEGGEHKARLAIYEPNH